MTQSLRNLRRHQPLWESVQPWTDYEWGKGVFLVPDAPVEVVLNFEKWRRSPDSVLYKSSGLSDEEYDALIRLHAKAGA